MDIPRCYQAAIIMGIKKKSPTQIQGVQQRNPKALCKKLK
jgi:hypothetical protein